jgi:predicted lysophospholipase L1 biosynthesis ABC-type transport system permease subunit
LISTWDVATKPKPVQVIVVFPLPTAIEFGLTELRVGDGLLIWMFTEFDVLLPSVTVIGYVPAVAVLVFVTFAVSWVADTNVVVRAVPLKFTTAPLAKPAPLTVSVKLVFALAVVGLIEVIDTEPFTVIETAFDTEPSGFSTVIAYDPGFAV